MIAIVAGAAIIAAVLIGFIVAVVRVAGWRFALGLFAFSAAITAIVAAASMLIGYGIEGHL